MKRLALMAASAVLAGGLALSAAPGTMAQPINCTAHVLDATAAQEVKTDVVQRATDNLRRVVPSADVYVQAYEQIPGGSVETFWQLGQEQCANWRAESGNRPKDNVFVVVYGRDVDDLGFFYGYGFMPVVYNKHDEVMKAVRSHLGPAWSQVNSDFVTTAMTEPLRQTSVLATKVPWHYYSEESGVYTPPTYVEPSGYEPTDWKATFRVIGYVVGGFLAAGLLLWLVSPLIRRSVE